MFSHACIPFIFFIAHFNSHCRLSCRSHASFAPALQLGHNVHYMQCIFILYHKISHFSFPHFHSCTGISQSHMMLPKIPWCTYFIKSCIQKTFLWFSFAHVFAVPLYPNSYVFLRFNPHHTMSHQICSAIIWLKNTRRESQTKSILFKN